MHTAGRVDSDNRIKSFSSGVVTLEGSRISYTLTKASALVLVYPPRSNPAPKPTCTVQATPLLR